MLEREKKLADRRQAKGIRSPEITTAPPLLQCKVAELSETQSNYLSLESVLTRAEYKRGFLQTHPLSAGHPSLPVLLEDGQSHCLQPS